MPRSLTPSLPSFTLPRTFPNLVQEREEASSRNVAQDPIRGNTVNARHRFAPRNPSAPTSSQASVLPLDNNSRTLNSRPELEVLAMKRLLAPLRPTRCRPLTPMRRLPRLELLEDRTLLSVAAAEVPFAVQDLLLDTGVQPAIVA